MKENEKEEEKIWWENLLLLGFDVVKEGEKHRIEFCRSMFDSSGNLKAMEVLIHFFLCTYDPINYKSVG